MSVVVAVATQGCSADSNIARSKAASEVRRGGCRRKNSSRASREELRLDGNGLQDLILASKLVPTGQIKPKSMYHEEAAPTTVPSSAEPSPSLSCLESDLWPSLQQAEAADAGWDLCSNASDSDALPDPALPLHTDDLDGDVEHKWWLLGEEDGGVDDAEEAKAFKGKLSFVDVLKSASVPTTTPVRRPRTPQSGRMTGQVACSVSNQEDALLEDDQLALQRRRGWTSHHKASWNTKSQRKLASAKAKRITQSCKSRGWLD